MNPPNTDDINCQIIKGIVYNFDGLAIGHTNLSTRYSRDRMSVMLMIEKPDKMIPKKKAKYAKPKKPDRAIKL